MAKGLYRRLALTNIKNQRRLYVPYILAGTGMAAMFYIMLYLTFSKALLTMRGGSQLSFVLALGCVVIGCFSVVILLYANSFLMKQRRRELGLYNILGMEKRHIARIMVWETALCGLGAVLLGLACGILFSKLVLLFLVHIMESEIPFGFEVSAMGILGTLLLFGGIYLLTLLSNLRQVHGANPIELLHSTSQGEREPRTKVLLTIIGCLTLGGGYAMAILVKDPAAAMLLFFVAVMLVIAGTYCLFTAGSISLLKLLRRNKGYYYKPRHFISVSGMLYRMKRNAVGLANICILSTMVLVMLSSTICLYSGLEDALRNQYPRHVSGYAYNIVEAADYENLLSLWDAAVRDSGIETENRLVYRYYPHTVLQDGGSFRLYGEEGYTSGAGAAQAYFIPLSDYKVATGNEASLGSGEMLVHCSGLASLQEDTLRFGELSYRLVSAVDKAEGMGIGLYDSLIERAFYFIVPGIEDIQAICEALDGEFHGVSLFYGVDLAEAGKDEALYEAFNSAAASFSGSEGGHSNVALRVTYAESARLDFLATYGGLFFLGVFLGLVFVMATVLIMYYKQVTEGYEDRGRYEIMQKVGMSRFEVKASIRSQVLTVFFLPLLAAGVHICFAFPMISRLFRVLSLTNVQLFLLCTVSSYLCFALLYLAVYALTARTYYKIVSR